MPAVTLFGALGGMGWQGVRIASADHVGGQWGMDWMRGADRASDGAGIPLRNMTISSTSRNMESVYCTC